MQPAIIGVVVVAEVVLVVLVVLLLLLQPAEEGFVLAMGAKKKVVLRVGCWLACLIQSCSLTRWYIHTYSHTFIACLGLASSSKNGQ